MFSAKTLKVKINQNKINITNRFVCEFTKTIAKSYTKKINAKKETKIKIVSKEIRECLYKE